jgi:hypothetical protein
MQRQLEALRQEQAALEAQVQEQVGRRPAPAAGVLQQLPARLRVAERRRLCRAPARRSRRPGRSWARRRSRPRRWPSGASRRAWRWRRRAGGGAGGRAGLGWKAGSAQGLAPRPGTDREARRAQACPGAAQALTVVAAHLLAPAAQAGGRGAARAAAAGGAAARARGAGGRAGALPARPRRRCAARAWRRARRVRVGVGLALGRALVCMRLPSCCVLVVQPVGDVA